MTYLKLKEMTKIAQRSGGGRWKHTEGGKEKYDEHPYTFHSGSPVIKNLPLLFSLSLPLICNSTLVL